MAFTAGVTSDFEVVMILARRDARMTWIDPSGDMRVRMAIGRIFTSQ